MELEEARPKKNPRINSFQSSAAAEPVGATWAVRPPGKLVYLAADTPAGGALSARR